MLAQRYARKCRDEIPSRADPKFRAPDGRRALVSPLAESLKYSPHTFMRRLMFVGQQTRTSIEKRAHAAFVISLGVGDKVGAEACPSQRR